MQVDLSVDFTTRVKTAIHNLLNVDENGRQMIHELNGLTVRVGSNVSEYVADSIEIDVTVKVPIAVDGTLGQDEVILDRG